MVVPGAIWIPRQVSGRQQVEENLRERPNPVVAYQLCQVLQEDLKGAEIKFQTGPLIQLYSAAKALTERLADLVGKLE